MRERECVYVYVFEREREKERESERECVYVCVYIRAWPSRHEIVILFTCLCDMTHAYVKHDSFIGVT